MPSLSSVRPSLLARSLLLAVSELIANAICWIVAAILFTRNSTTRPVLSLALLAWTLGLRHALDADHIRYKTLLRLDLSFVVEVFLSWVQSAIDNATRGLMSLGQLPVTCGLFFSLGHSTIVLVVTIAIAISSNIFEKMHRVGDVGGIVGAAVSGAFLFLVGLANTVILWKIFKQRQKEGLKRRVPFSVGHVDADLDWKPQHNQMLMMRILGPVMTFVNRPWKMYPVGVLFGFGFDTASSIALLGLSAIAKRGPDNQAIPSAYIVILPILFTAGMSLVDSMDSILMLWSYAGFPERKWQLFEKTSDAPSQVIHVTSPTEKAGDTEQPEKSTITEVAASQAIPSSANNAELPVATHPGKVAQDAAVKINVMSGLSIILTLMSILVAFSISLITIISLIGEQCEKCTAAAEAEDGGGLAGRWWRAWARANDNSGFIGVAIVGVFLTTVASWYGVRWIIHRRIANRRDPLAGDVE